MQTIATDDLEEAEALLKAADRQIGEVLHIVNSEGRGMLNNDIKVLPVDDNSNGDTEYSGSECARGENSASPTPSGSDNS